MLKSSAKRKSTALRELINSGQFEFRPGVAIAIHAQIAEKLGFKVVAVSGSNFSSQVLGLPDAGLITMTEVVENARRVANAVSIPVIVDCDTGFGNAINVRRTVHEIIQAGVAGLFFEDQVAPKRCGFVKGKEIVDLDEAIGKYRAAIDARDELDPDFVIIARTDARTAANGGMDETIARAKAYEDVGVDVLYVEALQSRDEMKLIREAVSLPLICSWAAVDPKPSTEEMLTSGQIMNSGLMFYKAGNIAMYDLLAQIKERGFEAFYEFQAATRSHPMGNYGAFDLAGFPKIAEMEAKYLQPEKLEKYDKSIGLYDPRIGNKP